MPATEPATKPATRPALAERLKRVQVAASVQMSIKARELKAAGKDVITLTTGEPNFASPPHAIEAAHAAALRGGFTDRFAFSRARPQRQASGAPRPDPRDATAPRSDRRRRPKFPPSAPRISSHRGR